MIEYNKKDKNGVDVVIRITEELSSYYEKVRCTILKEKEVNYILFKRVKLRPVRVSEEYISSVNEWTCEDFEDWADKALKAHNYDLTEKENDGKTLDLISGGCK